MRVGESESPGVWESEDKRQGVIKSAAQITNLA
jgi:hypothetical protein